MVKKYKIICVSLYEEDIQRLDRCVVMLKKKGITRANKSQVLRVALKHLAIDRVVNFDGDLS